MNGRRMTKKITKITALMIALSMILGLAGCGTAEDTERTPYEEKTALLYDEIVTQELSDTLGEAPAGAAGHVVFLSVCDTESRASVFTGTGKTLKDAWKAADSAASASLAETGLEPQWVKADVVFSATPISADKLARRVYSARHEFYRYGLALDESFEVALLEAELNGAKIYEYEEGGVDKAYLNSYLKKAGRTAVESLPDNYTLFECYGWLCDETNTIYQLDSDGLDYGRRTADVVDAEYVKGLIDHASQFLLDQVKEDGTFVYGIYPRFDNDIENYNIVRHASTIWSLVCRYRIEPSEELKEKIESTIDYMLSQIIYSDETTAYLYEEKDDEIKLGGCGVAVVAMTEYMDVFGSDKYAEVCTHLGNGILTMLDQNTGEYWHVLNGDFTQKEEFRTVYYDGEATFALCRLYSLTGDQKWIDASCKVADHFIEADYAQYKDHWVAYTMNELTKHITDRPEYYEFALHNAQANLDIVYNRDTTYHTYLEMMMATFEVYDRMVEMGMDTGDFDVNMFLKTIYTRADRQLDGFFFPEYAMYMENPQRVLNTFMVRHDGYRIRIDDVQHNIGGYYLYYKNYDKLVEYGMLEARDAE